MDCKIFYSWQSDLPNNTNRRFIEKALENAVKKITKDELIKIEPVIDRDTKDVPGSPNISDTIFKKIENSQIFLCDVSIINNSSQEARKTPNPNVLIELGYAIKALGDEKIIMAINSAYGEVELLPFDLKMKRTITYNIKKEEQDKSTERKQLEKKLECAIKTILASLSEEDVKKSIVDQFQESIDKNKSTDKPLLIDEFIRNTEKVLRINNPDFSSLDNPKIDHTSRVPILIESLNNTQELVIEFAQISQIIAMNNDIECAKRLYDGFKSIVKLYHQEDGVDEKYNEYDFDYYRIMGHRLFIIFFTALIKEEQWETIGELLKQGIYFTNIWMQPDQLRSFHYVLLDLSDWEYLKQDYIKQLESSLNDDRLKNIISFEDFQQTYLFLFFRSIKKPNNDYPVWLFGIKGMNKIPEYLSKSVQKDYAEKLLPAFGVKKIEELKTLIKEGIKVFKKQNRYCSDLIGAFRSENIGKK